jgi:hypothetical protein
MNIYLIISALILTGLVLVHSILGEKFIIQPVLKLQLPQLLGDELLTRMTIRMAWHITTLIGLGLAIILVACTWLPRTFETSIIIKIISGISFLSFIYSALAVRGRHLSWLAFLFIAVFAWLGA